MQPPAADAAWGSIAHAVQPTRPPPQVLLACPLHSLLALLALSSHGGLHLKSELLQPAPGEEARAGSGKGHSVRCGSQRRPHSRAHCLHPGLAALLSSPGRSAARSWLPALRTWLPSHRCRMNELLAQALRYLAAQMPLIHRVGAGGGWHAAKASMPPKRIGALLMRGAEYLCRRSHCAVDLVGRAGIVQQPLRLAQTHALHLRCPCCRAYR